MTMKKRARSALALLMAVVLCVGMVPSAFAAQQDSYHDPADHWQEANNRTNELDANATVTIETFTCGECGKATSFEVLRTPEYTRDGQTALTSFLAGELDMTELGTQQIMQQAEDAGYEIHSYSDGSSFYAMVNTSDPQLSNVNLRRALALGFDKQAFIDTAIGLPYSPMKAFTAPAVNGADGTSFSEALLAHEGVDAMAPVNGDIEAAKGYLETALKELGITADQLTLSIDCGDSPDAQTQAAFLQNQWLENLGIEVTINPKQPKQGSADRKNGNYQMSITGWSPDYNDPMTFLDMWVSDGGNNDTRWGTDEYDQLIADATVETDVNARQEMFYQCEETVFDQYFIIPIYNRTQSYVVSDKIANIQRSTFTDFNLMTVELA